VGVALCRFGNVDKPEVWRSSPVNVAKECLKFLAEQTAREGVV
jgi:hypothetical protein